MKSILLTGLTVAGLIATTPSTAHAHGGQYRGPGDVVPPGGGRGTPGRPTGPTTGVPGSPSAPTPTAPATGGGSGPATGGPAGPGGGRGPRTGGGAPLSPDLTRWSFWWEFNKDPFIRLRDAVTSGAVITGDDDFFMGHTRKVESSDSLRPTEQEILDEILPALKKAIDSTDQRDINSSCMVAMAKIGKNHHEFQLFDVFVPRLAEHDQEIAETAALSIGIAGIAGEQEMTMLVDLALDRGLGRQKSGGSVNNRTRAFALYGLGLAAHHTTAVGIKREAFQAMKAILADDEIRDRNVQVAAINGMAILNIGSSDAERVLLDEVLDTLETYYMQRVGAGRNLILSHCPTAIAKLIGREHARSEHFKELFAADLQDKGKIKRAGNEIAQSCAIALGLLCRPHDGKKSPDARYSELLLDQWDDNKDQQTRFYSVVSLGWIGGDENKKALLRLFDKDSNKAIEKPWLALALGVHAHMQYAAHGTSTAVDQMIGQTLLDELERSRTPDLTSALAIGLGLTRYTPAADLMRETMLAEQQQEELAGYLAVGLALIGDLRSKPAIQQVVAGSSRRFELIQQAAIALGKLGDKSVAARLLDLMDDGEPNLAKLSAIASAIGFIGDRRSIRPLIEMLFDDQLGDLSRAFAAVALGGIADKEDLPWNSKIGSNTNYRAAVETLTNRQTGVLDIL